ncbi:hypothetical protein M0L20_29730 [Spirosoma sp. RP8]|uniref:Uncharacterized protein n=1 Tax=Spirosoma liriopis TaxID=2937440 RepID=A0ABT0HV54_9BACT|nr:hypothetical protein [Spirosoma liriopis]MCK8496084.1 hypothetical protein [Spirosoma liriopis]
MESINDLTLFLANELCCDSQQLEIKEIDYRNAFSTKDVIFNTFLAYSDKEDLEAIIKIINLYTNAVEDIKMGNSKIAATKFDRADNYLNALYDNEISFALINCFAIPAKALLMYNTQNYYSAFKILKESFHYYDKIIDYNPTFFQAFKITQMYHLCKVLIKSDHELLSLKIMTNILSYLILGNVPKIKGSFEAKNVSNMPKEILSSLTAIFVIELVYVFAEIQLRKKHYEKKYFHFIYDILGKIKPVNYEQTLLYNWLKTKYKFYNEEYNDFAIEGAKVYNNIKVKNFDVIKFSLLLDFLQLKNTNYEDENYKKLLAKRSDLSLKSNLL